MRPRQDVTEESACECATTDIGRGKRSGSLRARLHDDCGGQCVVVTILSRPQWYDIILNLGQEQRRKHMYLHMSTVGTNSGEALADFADDLVERFPPPGARFSCTVL